MSQWYQHTVFTDEDKFYAALRADFEAARYLALMQSPFLRLRQLRLMRLPLMTMARRVRVCVFVQEPWGWHARDTASTPDLREFEECIKMLKSWGMHVTIRKEKHEKLIVIDHEIAWDGTLNLLSHRKTSERNTRWTSARKAEEIIASHRLYDCQECMLDEGLSLLSYAKVSDAERLAFLGQCFRRRRDALGLSQRDIAIAANVPQCTISDFESGKNIMGLTILKILGALDLDLVASPRQVVPVIEDFFRRGY